MTNKIWNIAEVTVTATRDNECDSAITDNESEDGSTTGKHGWCEYLQSSPSIT